MTPMSAGNKVNFNTMRSVFFFGLIIVLGIAMLYIIGPFLYPIFWAAVIAVMFYPLYTWLTKHTKMPRLSALLAIILVVVLLFLPLIFLSILLIQESVDLYYAASDGNFLAAVQSTTTQLQGSFLGPYLQSIEQQWTGYATNATKALAVFLFNNISSFTQVSVRFVFMFFIMLYTLYYFFVDGPRLLKRLMHLSPLGDKYEDMLYHRFTSAARATLKSTIIVGGIQGTIGGIFFWLAGIEGAFVWGVIMIILSIVPAIGAFLVWMPATIILFATGAFWPALIVLIGGLIVSVTDNFLRPPLIGKDTQMHPLIVLFATLGGLLIFGISGFVIGPVIAALFLSIMTIYDYYYKRELDNN